MDHILKSKEMPPHMIEHPVYNNAHIPGMAGIDQLAEFLIRSEAGINMKVIHEIVLVIFPRRENRIHIDTVDAKAGNVIQIFKHAADRPAMFAAAGLAVPVFFGFLVGNIPMGGSKAVREDVIHNSIPGPCWRRGDIGRMVVGQLIILRSVVNAVVRKEIAIIQKFAVAVVQFEIIADAFVGAVQDHLIVIKPFVLRFQRHLDTGKNHRGHPARAICIVQGTRLQIAPSCTQAENNMAWVKSVRIL